jgi:NADP-dependent 3-hydroxy acid dehydrogenase YdfG
LSIDGLCETEYDIACCQIDIGNAATDLAKAVLKEGRGAAQANGSVAKEPAMDLNHMALAIVQMARLPLDANVLFMTIMATKMPFVGRG